MSKTPRNIAASITVVALAAAVSCGERSDYYVAGDVDLFCRENPAECAGEIGGDCQTVDDCFDGACCTDKNCGGGMCTYRCDDDLDCPASMGCEHGFCFFACDDDADCGPGQKCEHGKTICEYEGGN